MEVEAFITYGAPVMIIKYNALKNPESHKESYDLIIMQQFYSTQNHMTE